MLSIFSFFTDCLQANLASVKGAKSDDIRNTYIGVIYIKKASAKNTYSIGHYFKDTDIGDICSMRTYIGNIFIRNAYIKDACIEKTYAKYIYIEGIHIKTFCIGKKNLIF